jgi:hypothetical protein
MRRPEERHPKSEATKIIWCACEHCGAVGPQFVTAVRNNHEFTNCLRAKCCHIGWQAALKH